MKAKFFIFMVMCFVGISQLEAQIVFEITLRNNHDTPIDISFSKGELYEVQGENMQHIVLFRDTIIILRGRETRTIQLEGYCANEHRASPRSETPVMVTAVRRDIPVMDKPITQDIIWKIIRESYQ